MNLPGYNYVVKRHIFLTLWSTALTTLKRLTIQHAAAGLRAYTENAEDTHCLIFTKHACKKTVR